jgi:glyoxalase family protein
MSTATVTGLHHVTATVDGAQEDLDFCRHALGLRLVKRTVNFDNHHVFHFYYGDVVGTPGTLWTTFPYRGWRVPTGTVGAGQVTATAFSIPAGSVGAWTSHLNGRGIEVETSERFDTQVLTVRDPSGLSLELATADTDPRIPWDGGGIAPALAIRGLDHVTLSVTSAADTVAFVERYTGGRVERAAGARTRLALGAEGSGGAGRQIDIVETPSLVTGVNGLGTVHHVALIIRDAESQLALREQLRGDGFKPTDVRDRCYFQSIYVRIPGGVLFEFATPTPGFTVDEPVASLGEALKLPPWEESNRAAIEPHLTPIVLS